MEVPAAMLSVLAGVAPWLSADGAGREAAQ